jgi:MarR family transcriptional regulator for hemolysin
MTGLQYDFDNSLGYWIILTAHAFERALNHELAPQGITHRQWQVLAWLAMDKELCQADLAERMRIEPPTLVRVLDRMEHAGWILRRDDPTDRRKKVIAATDKAVPIWTRAAECARQVRARASAGMNTEEVESLRGVLQTIQSNLATSAGTKKESTNAPQG